MGLGRFELPTNGLGNRCSIHLSYSPALPHCNTFLASGIQSLRFSYAGFSPAPHSAPAETRFSGVQSWRHLRNPQTLENRRPILLQQTVGCAKPYSNPATLKCLSRRSLRGWKINVCQRLRHHWPQRSRQVERFASRIRSNHKYSPQRMSSSRSKPAVQFHKVSRIFMQQRRQQKSPKKMARSAAGHRRAESFSVPLAALSVAGERASRFANSRPGHGTEYLRRRRALAQEQLEFLPGTQCPRRGRQLGIKVGLSRDQPQRSRQNILRLVLVRSIRVLLRFGSIWKIGLVGTLLRHSDVARQNNQYTCEEGLDS